VLTVKKTTQSDKEIISAIAAVTGVEKDYPRCLNAMAEAERFLTGAQAQEYLFACMDAMNLSSRADMVEAMQHVFRCPAAERARAFVRVINNSCQ
jgi:hypothetical protein